MESIPVYATVPFVLMLASIAVLPMFAANFWDKNKNKLIISLILGLPTAIWLIANNHIGLLEHSMLFDYLPFVILLGGLFVTTGGIFIDADFEATPRNNTIILAIGGILAPFIGTTGAAMLLIRLILHTNKARQYKAHIMLFFIAIVANCGGLLTPLGDPPLFMMYLRGVDFFWFFSLFKSWIFVNGMLLIIFYIWDSRCWKKETEETKSRDREEYVPMVIHGKINFVWLLMIVCAVAFVNPNYLPFMQENPAFGFIRDAIIVSAAVLSLLTTKKKFREENSFNWHPIQEVAYLFFGIFLTMIPVLEFLQNNASQIPLTSTTSYYYITGALSSFLDNTPTALTFYSLAKGYFAINPALITPTTEIVAGIPALFMEAICLGAVFFGAMTYIGNGPNFMVKSIAEQNGINMPQFFKYIIKFSLIILLPVLILNHLLFI